MIRRKEYQFFFTFFLISNVCWGQFTALNKYYQMGARTVFNDLIIFGDSLTILGDIFHPDSTNLRNVCLFRTDTNGVVSKTKILYDPLGLSPNLISEHVKFTQTADRGFVFTSGPFTNPSSFFFFKLNNNLEINFVKEIELGNCAVFDVKVLELADAFYIGLLVCRQNGDDSDYCIVKTDLQGNKLWHKFYGTEDNYEFLFNIKSFKEGEITMLGNKGLNNKGRMTLTTIDTSGAVIKDIFNEGDNEGNIYDIDTLSNGDYIYICSELKNVTDYRSSLRVYRITSEGELVWKKVINDDVINAFIYRMHRNANGSYTIIGQEDGVGRSLCITPDGEILWQHLYYLPFSPLPIEYYSSLLGMTALPSGNIIACGYFRNLDDPTTQEQGWLLKMDAHGCIEKNCKTLLSDQEVIQIDELQVGVYPNPSNGLLNVNIPYGQNMDDCMIKIYDIVGNSIFSTKLHVGINEIDLTKKLGSGIMIYSIKDMQDNILKTGKIIVTK